MSTAGPSIGVIRAQIRAIRNKAPHAKAFGIFAPGRWTGPTVHGEGNDQIAIYQCDSPLQMRLALQSAPETASATVLITPLDDAKVSDDILVRLALRKLQPINRWEIVRSLFKAKQLDPRITRHSFLAEMLLENASTREFQPVAGGLVDADTVWGLLLTERLGFSGPHPDLVDILRGTAESDLATRWNACSGDFREAATSWIAETAGDTASTVLGCIEAEHGPKALAIGLVMDVVYHEAVGHELDKAAGRLEAYVGTTNLPTDIARRWRDAAVAAAGQLAKAALRRSLDDAEAILENIGAKPHAWRSNELESGFEQRLVRFGRALAAHVDARATSISEELQQVYGSLQRHRMGRGGGRRMERVVMAVRLSRWLANQDSGGPPAPSSMRAIARRYAVDGGFVDWARRVLRGGEPNKDLAAAFVRLVDRVTELREAENRQFAKALVAERATCDPMSELVPVEHIVERIVANAAEKAPVLLLLVDGMSWAVFRELIVDIKSHYWIELGFAPSPQRSIGLAALPSVTEVCRTSLFCGSLRRGQAADEVQGFGTNPTLTSMSPPGFAPKLFHKAALEGDEDSSLAGEIRSALAEKKQRIVGIVINAVDDHLDKGEQTDPLWTLQHIRVLEPILAEARSAGRCVVLLSDHGHVLDRQTEFHEGSDGLRWRRPGGAVRSDEVEITSPRVVIPEGNRIVVPWSEHVRYGAKKNGYHGGVCPQEMLIPISVLWPALDPPEGFADLPVDLPVWWSEPTVALPIPTAVELPPPPKKGKPLPLFDELEKRPVVTAKEEAWIKALLECELFAAQRRLAGRVQIEDEVLRRLLSTLANRGGSMTVPALAGALGEPEHRLRGRLAIIQRMLNVEGYPILDRQDVSNTVVLNVPLLKKQFELGE